MESYLHLLSLLLQKAKNPFHLTESTLFVSNGNSNTLYAEDGSMYEGSCDHGLPSGEGRITYPNQCVWEGSWYQGKRQGRGRYYYSESLWYDGEWEEDHCMSQDEFITNKGIYLNESRLFNRETCQFSFMTERETILCFDNTILSQIDVTPNDVFFLGCFTKNPLFLESVFNSNCCTMIINIQSPLDSHQLNQLLSFLSFIPTLKTLRIHSTRSSSSSCLVPTITAIDIPDTSLQQLHTLAIQSTI